MGDDLQKHDWDAVRDALCDLMAHIEATEPHAVNSIAALDAAINELPENE